MIPIFFLLMFSSSEIENYSSNIADFTYPFNQKCAPQPILKLWRLKQQMHANIREKLHLIKNDWSYKLDLQASTDGLVHLINVTLL